MDHFQVYLLPKSNKMSLPISNNVDELQNGCSSLGPSQYLLRIRISVAHHNETHMGQGFLGNVV